MSNTHISGLAKSLIDANIISAKDASNFINEATHHKLSLVTYLVKESLASARLIAECASQTFGVPLVDLAAIEAETFPRETVNEKLIEQHNLLPIFLRGNRLFIAISDPTNLRGLDEVKFQTGLNTDFVIVEEDKLSMAIEKFMSHAEDVFGDLSDEEFDFGPSEEEEKEKEEEIKEEAPIVKFVNKVLLDAIKRSVSDIHFEPYEKAYRVRFRLDGILEEISRLPVAVTDKISARLKVMSKMDISEKRIPQDGRIKLKINQKRSIDFRVNTLPTLWGEKIVLRILDADSAKLGIEVLGYEDDQKQLYLDALGQPQGMILVTGPTGSGKTVSLYTGLNILNTPECNISTAEDPVEINLEGINQVNVNTKVGLDFGSALRAFLRQDPDIVMVGEIRDLETAEIAIKAAQTGHLVLSTLHTNSAPETLTRLRNMGVPSFNIATSVTLIIAQRLARRLCKCKKKVNYPKEILVSAGFSEDELDQLTIYGPNGCSQCNKGYKGRVGIYEVVKITDAISRIIMEDGNAIQIADVASSEGFMNLRQAALKKARDGVTSLEEVNRVTSDA